MTAVAFGRLANGRVLLASGSRDGVVRLWDPATGVAIGELFGHSGAVTAVAFGSLPDGRVLWRAGATTAWRGSGTWPPASPRVNCSATPAR